LNLSKSLDGLLESKQEKDELLDEVLWHVSRTGVSLIPPIIVTAVIFGSFLYTQVDNVLLVTWLIIYISFPFYRRYIVETLPYKTHISYEKRVSWLIILGIAGGLNYASTTLWFSHMSTSQQTILTLYLLGCVSASTATTAGFRPLFLSLNLPITLALVAVWIFFPKAQLDVFSKILIAFMMVLYFFVQYGIAKKVFEFFVDHIKSRNREKRLNEELQDAFDRVTASSNSKTRFLASASHDLRQPIHTLQLLSAALSMQALDKKSNKIAVQMDAALDNMASQMDGLLDISKLDAGIIEKDESIFDLIPFLERISCEFEGEFKRKGLSFEYAVNAETALTKTDREQLERVIRNLLSNAVKYTQQGKVKLSLEYEKNSWQIELKDTGIGIAEEDKERVFEEFYQVANPERDRTQGLGLGLAIVRRLNDLLNIAMTIESTLGVGTTLNLELPYERFDGVIESCEVHTEGGNLSLKGVKVLCLDDEVAVRNALLELFEGFGCEVQLCRDIAEIQATLKNYVPDILLADFRLVGNRTGIEAINIARQTIPNLPALLISGDTAPERLQQAEKAKIKLLHKPVKPQILKAEILKLLS